MLPSAMMADGHDTAEASGRRVAGSTSGSLISFNVSVSLSLSRDVRRKILNKNDCWFYVGREEKNKIKSETRMTASFTWDVRGRNI